MLQSFNHSIVCSFVRLLDRSFVPSIYQADLNAWDVAAGAVLIHEAGGSVVDMADPYGAPYGLATRRILATNGDPVLLRALHRELAAVRATRLEDDAE